MQKYKIKWYAAPWLISLFLIIGAFNPGISLLGLVVLYFLNKELSHLKLNYITNLEIELRRKQLEDDESKILQEAREKANSIIGESIKANQDLMNENSVLEQKIKKASETLKDLDKEVFSKYVNIETYENITSEECKNNLSLLKIKENELIKSDNAIIVTSRDDKKVLNNNIKQLLRSFNVECENLSINVSAKNIETTRNKIIKSFEALNKLFSTDGVQLSKDLLSYKLEAITLVYEYELKKEQEREQQKAIKEQMIEEEKVRREIEKEKQKIEKEEAQFKNEINKLMKYMQKSQDDIQNQLYIDKIKELEENLKLLEKDKADILNREQNTRAGFVYIISNIGSFGEDVYKIGMTRRLVPMDRVKELSDASVPFEFDVHAMIFSADAPALESLLHQTFKNNQMNKINPRKEFFKVPLSKIMDIVKNNYNSTVEFTMIAEAKQYRETLELEKTIA